MRFHNLVATSAAALNFSACVPVPTKPVTTRNSELTHGNVQLNLKVGETSQTQGVPASPASA